VELSVDPRALHATARRLSAASRGLADACARADATLTAGAASLEAAAGTKVGTGWSQLHAAVGALAAGYDRVGWTLDALARTYAELDRDVVRAGGGPQ
jgi:uncharacterized protein YukE